MNALHRESGQRNFIINGLKNANSEDIILISDVDEIPNLENIIFDKKKKKIIFFNQDMLYYKFNLKLPNLTWTGTRGCKKKYLKSPQWIRNIKDRKYPFYRLDAFFSEKKFISCEIIKNGGWHFTNLKSPKELYEKLNNFGHHDEFELSNITVEELKEKMNKKEVFYNHMLDKTNKSKWDDDYKLKKIDHKFLPEFLVLNYKNYKDWFDHS